MSSSITKMLVGTTIGINKVKIKLKEGEKRDVKFPKWRRTNMAAFPQREENEKEKKTLSEGTPIWLRSHKRIG